MCVWIIGVSATKQAIRVHEINKIKKVRPLFLIQSLSQPVFKSTIIPDRYILTIRENAKIKSKCIHNEINFKTEYQVFGVNIF